LFGGYGLVLTGVGVILTTTGVGLLVGGFGMNDRIDDEYRNRNDVKARELTMRKDAFVLGGAIGLLGPSVVALGAGLICLSLPTKYRLWIISTGQGIGVKGKF